MPPRSKKLVSPKKKGAKKSQSPKVVEANVDNTENVETVESAPVPAVGLNQKTGAVKKLSKKSKKLSAKPVVNNSAEPTVETELATVTETVTETSQKAGGKRIRSFKVQLPGNETFEGRFTGLTPYQAANKALSKYYRETSKPKKEIRFTIRESTRGSKRNHYTYNGRREKLKKPVEYSINDGRVITKNYKNKLTKIKKAELALLNSN